LGSITYRSLLLRHFLRVSETIGVVPSYWGCAATNRNLGTLASAMAGVLGKFYHIPAFTCYNGEQGAEEHRVLVLGSLREGLDKPFPQGEDCILKILADNSALSASKGQLVRKASSNKADTLPAHEDTKWRPVKVKADLPLKLQGSQLLSSLTGTSALYYKEGTSAPSIFLLSAIKEHREWLIKAISENFMGGIIIRNPRVFQTQRYRRSPCPMSR
jgi:hypothetical protein